VKFIKVIQIPIGIEKYKCSIRVNILGFELALLWRCDEWSWGFIMGLFGRGICFDRDIGFWSYHEELGDVWLADEQ